MIVDLSGKVAIVTGAGQGIGEGIARVFAKAGAKVVLATRSQANGQAVTDSIVKGGGVAWLNQTDVGRHSEVKRVVAQTVERFGRLDIVIHNAAVYPVLSIEQLTDADIDLTLSVNLKAGFWFIQEALPHLRKQGGGRFIFTSSVTGPNVAMPGTAHYAASKCGLNGLIRTAALEYARQNITVNGVEPGYILTPAMDALGGPEASRRWRRKFRLESSGPPPTSQTPCCFLPRTLRPILRGRRLSSTVARRCRKARSCSKPFIKGQ